MSVFQNKGAVTITASVTAALLAAGLLTACGSGSAINSAPETSIAELTSSADESTVSDSAADDTTAAQESKDSSENEQSSADSESSDSAETTDGSSAAGSTASEGTTGSTAGGNSTTAGTTATTASNSQSTTASQTSTSVTQPGKEGFGAKWPDLFTNGGSPIVTANSYKSEDVNVQISKQTYGDSVYYVADIHVRYVENLKSAFSVNRATGVEEFGESGGANYQEDGAKLSKRVNSILTINGDYYSGHFEGSGDARKLIGVIFRNGTRYWNNPRAEVGAIYQDGTYQGFTKTGFDLDTEEKKGLWQVMGFEPRLVENGKAITEFHTYLGGMMKAAPRSGFGYYEPGHYCFVVADGRQAGYSVGPELDVFAKFFETLGCEGAFNLDGGASSQMYFMGELVNRPSTTTSGGSIRMLPDVFYIGEVN